MYIFKKIGKTSLSILLLSAVLFLQPLSAQDSDYIRMEQDLKMMKKVLAELFRTGNPDTRTLTVRTRNTDAQYIQGFGIVMHTPLFYTNGRNTFSISGRTHSNQNILVWPDKDNHNTQGQVRVIQGKAKAPKSEEDHDDSIEYDEYDDGRMSQEEIDEKKIDLMTYFLMNYGDLAKELPKDEKILLVYGPKGNESNNTISIASVWRDEPEEERKGPGTITVSAEKKDIDRFRRKELSEEDFSDELQISNLHPDNQKRMPFHILGQILQDVVGEHTVRTRWETNNNIERRYKIATDLGPKPKITYEILAGYGAVYQIQMRSSLLSIYGHGKGGKSRVSIERNDQAIERSDKQVDSTYQKMVPEVQKAMIEYGRTLRDLASDEWLSVKIDIPACENCESPSVVEINVPQKVLEEYDRRSISLDTALGRMEVRGKGQAKDKAERSNYIYFGDDGDE